MYEIESLEQPLPLRQNEKGIWEVNNEGGHWLACDNESDARIISNAPIIMDNSFHIVPPNEIVAKQLEETAYILRKYNIGFGYRFLKQRAKVARGKE